MKYYSDSVAFKGEVYELDYWLDYLQNFTTEETLTLELQKIHITLKMWLLRQGSMISQN